MKSEKSKVLGALMPSESCHDEFEVLYLQYSYDMAHTFYLALCLALRLFLVFEKKTTKLYTILNILRGKVAYASPLT